MRDLIEKLIAQMVETGVFFQDAVSEFEKKYIRKVLEQSGGNQSKAAKALGMHRNTLGRKMEEYHLAARNGSRSKASRAPRAKRPK
ncbi:MAG: histidine kinase [Acidobacteria bacterium]|nr:histidine kinase [Acidobacteriota bacterium]